MSGEPEDPVVAERLRAAVPAPAPTWRGETRRTLLARGVPPGRPAQLWPLVAGLGASGAVLLGLAAALI